MHETLKNKVLKIFDIAYGGEFGLDQLIRLSSEVIFDNDLVIEKKAVEK